MKAYPAQCLTCYTQIRKNAKYCILHSAEVAMQHARIASDRRAWNQLSEYDRRQITRRLLKQCVTQQSPLH